MEMPSLPLSPDYTCNLLSIGILCGVLTETVRGQNPSVCLSPVFIVLQSWLGPEEVQQDHADVPKSLFPEDGLHHFRSDP